MKTEQLRLKNGQFSKEPTLTNANLVLVFGEGEEFRTEEFFKKIRSVYQNAIIAGCSSSGNILSNTISHDDAVLTAVVFDKTTVKMVKAEISSTIDSKELAINLGGKLDKDGLQHVVVISDGLNLNGSDFADGFNELTTVTVSGGLAGDGVEFQKTFVIADAPAESNIILALGIYGESTVLTGSFAGFDEFGVEKTVTKSSANIVYEIDGEPALDMYKRYLGAEAEGLPMSGLYFPISVKESESSVPLIRTLLAIDNDSKSLTFAGTVKQGSTIRLMKSNIDNLTHNAALAAKNAKCKEFYSSGVCLVVSCVGRMIIMKQMVEEELDEVKNEIGENVAIIGFYSYGELAPHIGLKKCSLHNQTMTITAIYE